MDSDTIGPLFKRIKCLGVASKDEYGIPLPGPEGETITQARFVESLIVYLTSDRKLDRDRLLRRESLLPADDDELKIRPFRNLFVSGEEGDFAIADIVGNFFDAVRERWPQAWADTRRGGLMLCRTNGFAALMRVLRPAYISVAAPGSPVRKSQFSELLAQARFEDSDFTTENFPPGSSGEAELRQALLEQMGLEE